MSKPTKAPKKVAIKKREMGGGNISPKLKQREMGGGNISPSLRK